MEYRSYFFWKLITELPVYKLSVSFHYVLSSSGNDVLQEGIETTGFLRQDKWPRWAQKLYSRFDSFQPVHVTRFEIMLPFPKRVVCFFGNWYASKSSVHF
jgi:hypothetical protein